MEVNEMKRKTKKRIELLELAIKAANQRCSQLEDLIDSALCPLCMNMSIFDGCENCPANEEAKYSCDDYGWMIENIRGKLMAQAEVWRKEIERLKKT